MDDDVKRLPARREDHPVFRFFPPSYDPGFDEDETLVIEDWFHGMRSTPVISSALICRGHACEVVAHCPLHQLMKPLPTGYPCPVERALIRAWTEDLISELDVEFDAWTDLSQISDLIQARILAKRSQEIIATSNHVVDAFKGYTQDGDPILEPKLHPILLMFEKTGKLKDRLLESLIATREAKSKDKTRETMSAAQLASTVMQKVQEMREKNPRYIDNMENDLQKAEQRKVEILDIQPQTPEEEASKERI